MTADFFLQALISLALVIGLFQDVRHSGSLLTGCAFLTVAAVMLTVAGVFPTDLGDPAGGPPHLATPAGIVHNRRAIVFSAALLPSSFFPAPTEATTDGKPRADSSPSRGRIPRAFVTFMRWFGGILEAWLSEERLPPVSSGCS
jgi:hypothetical protein